MGFGERERANEEESRERRGGEDGVVEGRRSIPALDVKCVKIGYVSTLLGHKHTDTDIFPRCGCCN